jgi:hypothetical protein
MLFQTLMVCVGLTVVVTCAIGFLKFIDWLEKLRYNRRNPPEKLLEDAQKYAARVLAPNWPLYEAHLKRTIPAALVAVYKDQQYVEQDYAFGVYYLHVSPIDAQAIADNWVLKDVLPFANADGDPIFFKAGAMESNAVHIAYHDGGGTEELAPDIGTFLAGLTPLT